MIDNRNPIPEKEYDLIEIFDQMALFSEERVSDDDIPAGLYRYEIRADENGDFATLEPSVRVDFAGTIITREPLDFGDGGYIDITGTNSPNFHGYPLTLNEFTTGDMRKILE